MVPRLILGPARIVVSHKGFHSTIIVDENFTGGNVRRGNAVSLA